MTLAGIFLDLALMIFIAGGRAGSFFRAGETLMVLPFTTSTVRTTLL